jgi:hypothetical protein
MKQLFKEFSRQLIARARRRQSFVSRLRASVQFDWLQGTDGVDARMRLEQGFDMVSITTDIGTISKGIMQEVADVEGGIAGKRNGY